MEMGEIMSRAAALAREGDEIWRDRDPAMGSAQRHRRAVEEAARWAARAAGWDGAPPLPAVYFEASRAGWAALGYPDRL